MAKHAENLQGSLELLILRALDHAPNHGFGIVAHILKASDGLLHIEEGSLYPALHRLERQKFVVGDWEQTKERPASQTLLFDTRRQGPLSRGAQQLESRKQGREAGIAV